METKRWNQMSKKARPRLWTGHTPRVTTVKSSETHEKCILATIGTDVSTTVKCEQFHRQMMTGELKPEYKNQLQTWIGVKHKFTLLYSASRDGCNVTTFHGKCDNKGPTVTVLYNTNQTVFGGYTAVSWNGNGNYCNDGNAFLFRLQYNGQLSPLKFPRNGTGNDIYCHSSYGPTFGSGHDLYTFNGTINNNGTYFPLNGSCSLGNAYNMQGQNYNSFANGHLQVTDLEVYLVSDFDSDDPMETPWRKSPEWNTRFMQELKERIETFKPLKEMKLQQANVLLVGQVGAGKSSFFNTMNSIFRGYVTSQACSGSTEHSLTTHYRMYSVRNSSTGKSLGFRLCDTRGLEEDQGLDNQEVSYVLDGNIPDRYMFNPSVPASPDITGFNTSPKLKDKIHCVAFVVDASSVDVMSEKVLERMRSLQLKMNQRGIPQVVLLTKIDKVCQPLSQDVSKVFCMSSVQQHVDKVAQILGLPRAHVLPVKNYESEIELDDNINILALITMRQILQFADDFLYNFLDQMESKEMGNMSIKD